MKGQKWILEKNFVGEPKDEDLQLVEEDLPDELQENQVLTEALFLSVDPYMRLYTNFMKTPMVMVGEQISRVIKTRNGQYPLGTLVTIQCGWRSHYLSPNGEDLVPIKFDLGSISASYCLGLLGMPGATAYFGLRLLEPKEGDVIVVNGAAGAVGHTVGQLAKIKGCKVIGFVGSDDKLEWCQKELGFDHVFNYKKCNFSEEIAKIAPNGVELFFDNVGGEWYSTIINKHMKKYGKVLLCGSIENYNDKTPQLYPATNLSILSKELRVQGIIVTTFLKEYGQAFTEMKKYMEEGKLKTNETVSDFQQMREAFYGLFKGENTGKAVVKYTPKQ